MSELSPTRVVIDTNVLLDLWVYDDPRHDALRSAIGTLEVCGTPATREEFRRVLAYPHIAARLARDDGSADAVMREYDAAVSMHEAAPKAPCTCKDADDQKFIDLAVALQCPLISQDKAVLKLKNRLSRLGAAASAVWPLAVKA